MNDLDIIPGPDTSQMGWADRGACLAAIRAGTAHRDWWFPEQRTGRSAETVQAKAICGGCSVKSECFEWAVRNRESGIWAGTTERDRSRARVNRPADRTCAVCELRFTPAGQETTCSAACWLLRKRAQRRAAADKRLVGAMYEEGHGIPSRYNAGCRCPACRRVTRDRRRESRDTQRERRDVELAAMVARIGGAA